MEKSHESGVATHIGPESCGAAREGGVEAVRRVYIAKTDGRQRPLGVPVLEDKIVQRATVEVLNAICETDFLGLEIRFRAAPSVNVEDGGAGGRPVNVA
jgi:hypothetical protein